MMLSLSSLVWNHRIDVAIVTQKGGDKSTEQGAGRPIRAKTVPKETLGGDPTTGQHGHLDRPSQCVATQKEAG